MLKKAFTLIELLVVVVIVGIIVVAVTIALNPTQRIIDAQTANLRAQVAAVGSAFDICMNYVNPPAFAPNGYAGCNTLTLLTAAATPGGPFLKTNPAAAGITWAFQSSGTAPTNLNGCVNASTSIGGSTAFVQYRSADNSVTAPPLPVTAPACP